MKAPIHLAVDLGSEHATPSRQSQRSTASPVGDGGIAGVLAMLQRNAGNQAVNRLLRQHGSTAVQRQATPEDEGATDQAKEEIGLEGGPFSPELAERSDSSRGDDLPFDEDSRPSPEGGSNLPAIRRVIQRDDPPKAYNIDDPLGTKSAVNTVVAQTEAERAPIYSWLDKNPDTVNGLSVGLTSINALVWQVQHNAPDVEKLSAEQIQQAIYMWAAKHSVTIPKLPPPDNSNKSSELSNALLSAAKGAWTWANDGTTIAQTSTNRWNIRVSGQLSGLVTEVKDKNDENKGVSITAGWDGSVNAQFGAGAYHFSAQVSKDAWQVELSLGLDSTVKTVDGLSQVFHSAGTGLVNIVKRNPKDVTNGTVGTDLSSVADAVSALKAVKDAPTISAGITAGGPLTGGPSEPGQAPQGWSIQATVTVKF